MTATPYTNGGSRTEHESETAFFHDWGSDESLSTEIVSAIADLAGTDAMDVDRLYDRIDPDSLEAIFEPSSENAPRNAGKLSFQLDAYTITVHASGFVVVTRSS